MNTSNGCIYHCGNCSQGYDGGLVQCTLDYAETTVVSKNSSGFCSDIDECQSNPCNSDQQCRNLDGGFACLNDDCPHICNDLVDVNNTGVPERLQNGMERNCSLQWIESES